MESKKDRPRKPPKRENPILSATRAWLTSLPPPLEQWTGEVGIDGFLAQHVPKRFTIYEPMALLPSGSFTNTAWRALRVSPDVGDEKFNQLWELILQNLPTLSSGRLTHLAVNGGIPLQSAAQAQDEAFNTVDNILRSPSELTVLFGDFGPSELSSEPSDADFDKAFWASAKQNGICQTWAPRWTMFSRGNVKEKARLLSFSDGQLAQGVPIQRELSRTKLQDTWAVDLYAGIGYFTFSYAMLGMKVLCWELNPWSVEGLRRGAKANGWTVRVIKGDDLRLPSNNLISGTEMILVFLEDNKHASRRIAEIRAGGTDLDTLHVNCGLLPTSQPVWQDSWAITRSCGESWLHLHENVGVHNISQRRIEIQQIFDDWATSDSRESVATVEHVELVKTYAPDVWHCVFDVRITRT